MITVTLTEIIFIGKKSAIGLFRLLKDLLTNYKNARFNSPENSLTTFENINEIFNTNDYVDFVVTLDKLRTFEEDIPNVFVNLSADGERVELIFFFDLKDLKSKNYKKNIEALQVWAIAFKSKYCLEYFRCQIDNGDEEEYYFDINTWGPMYNML